MKPNSTEAKIETIGFYSINLPHLYYLNPGVTEVKSSLFSPRFGTSGVPTDGIVRLCSVWWCVSLIFVIFFNKVPGLTDMNHDLAVTTHGTVH